MQQQNGSALTCLGNSLVIISASSMNRWQSLFTLVWPLSNILINVHGVETITSVPLTRSHCANQKKTYQSQICLKNRLKKCDMLRVILWKIGNNTVINWLDTKKSLIKIFSEMGPHVISFILIRGLHLCTYICSSNKLKAPRQHSEELSSRSHQNWCTILDTTILDKNCMFMYTRSSEITIENSYTLKNTYKEAE